VACGEACFDDSGVTPQGILFVAGGLEAQSLRHTSTPCVAGIEVAAMAKLSNRSVDRD
jgi:hypothetical protein